MITNTTYDILKNYNNVTLNKDHIDFISKVFKNFKYSDHKIVSDVVKRMKYSINDIFDIIIVPMRSKKGIVYRVVWIHKNKGSTVDFKNYDFIFDENITKDDIDFLNKKHKQFMKDYEYIHNKLPDIIRL